MQYGGQIEHIQTMTKLRNLLYYFSISYDDHKVTKGDFLLFGTAKV